MRCKCTYTKTTTILRMGAADVKQTQTCRQTIVKTITAREASQSCRAADEHFSAKQPPPPRLGPRWRPCRRQNIAWLGSIFLQIKQEVDKRKKIGLIKTTSRKHWKILKERERAVKKSIQLCQLRTVLISGQGSAWPRPYFPLAITLHFANAYVLL